MSGDKMAYEQRGHGAPLLLIHGYPLSRRLWEPQLAGLEDAANMLAPDLPGFGDSSALAEPGEHPAPHSMDQYADDCAALLDALGISTPVIVGGLSMGGYIALAFQRRHPQRVAGLLLAATRAAPDSQEAKANREKAVALAKERGVSAIAESMLPRMMSPATYEGRPEVVALARSIMLSASVEGIVAALQGMRDRPDSTPTLSDISVPVLILHGADDALIPVSDAETMQALIPGAQLRVLPQAGHLLNLEQPDLFNQAVRRFLVERIK